MTEKEIRELIKILRDRVEYAGEEDDLTEAADALEATLWKPMDDIPEELKDGRELLVSISHYKSKITRRVTMQYLYGDFRLCDDSSKLNYYWDITHYREITAPEQEKADE